MIGLQNTLAHIKRNPYFLPTQLQPSGGRDSCLKMANIIFENEGTIYKWSKLICLSPLTTVQFFFLFFFNKIRSHEVHQKGCDSAALQGSWWALYLSNISALSLPHFGWEGLWHYGMGASHVCHLMTRKQSQGWLRNTHSRQKQYSRLTHTALSSMALTTHEKA